MNNKTNDDTTSAMGHDPLAWLIGDDTSVTTSGLNPDEKALEQPVSGDIVLEGSLCIPEVEGMHQVLQQILKAKVNISIESEALSRIDTAGTQLLYAFVQETKKQKLNLQWKSISDVLRDTTKTLALDAGMDFENV